MEPWGFEADLFGHGVTAAAVYNVNRQKGHKVSPLDFLPKEEEKQRQTEPGAVYRVFRSIAMAMGAKKNPAVGGTIYRAPTGGKDEKEE